MEDGSGEAANKKNCILALESRIDVIRDSQTGLSMRQLADKYQCGKTQIFNIIANQNAWLKEWEANGPSGTKRRRKERYETVNRSVLDWIVESVARGAFITGIDIQTKAKEIAERLHVVKFSASNGWLDSFRKRYNVTCAPKSGFFINPDPPKLKPATGTTGGGSPVGSSKPTTSAAASTSSAVAPSPRSVLKPVPQAVPPPAPIPKSAPDNKSDQSDGEVCLRWNSHHSNMQTTFPSLLDSEQYVDVTLAAEGRLLKCHRLILSSCSTYFDDILKGIVFPQHPVIFLKDIPFWIIKALVDFMYKGEVNIDQSKLPDLLHAAEILQVKGLAGKHNSGGGGAAAADEPKQPPPSRGVSIPRAPPAPIPSLFLETMEDMPSTSSAAPRPPPTARPPSPKRVRKRKSTIVEVPAQMPTLRRGTKSRPNIKQPKFYDTEYTDSLPSPTGSYSPDPQQQPPSTPTTTTTIKVEPIDVYETDISFNMPIDDPFHELSSTKQDPDSAKNDKGGEEPSDEDDVDVDEEDDEMETSTQGENVKTNYEDNATATTVGEAAKPPPPFISTDTPVRIRKEADCVDDLVEVEADGE